MERKRTATNRALRKSRIRARVHGTAQRPRLTVSVSNRHVHAQLVDDDAQRTVVASSTVGKKQGGKLKEQAAWVGEDIAKKAKKAKVSKVVFDRSGRRYHGRVATLADAARKTGLEF